MCVGSVVSGISNSCLTWSSSLLQVSECGPYLASVTDFPFISSILSDRGAKSLREDRFSLPFIFCIQAYSGLACSNSTPTTEGSYLLFLTCFHKSTFFKLGIPFVT